MASATVSFGMVSIPVNLYSATESKASVSFNLLHDKCKTRLKQQYICPTDEGEIVTRDHMVKGYEFTKGQYVTFTDEEIKALQEESNRLIEITEFLPIAQVDPIFYAGAYYLGPDKGGDRAYQLLAEAMRQTGRCALAKWAARGKQYLVLLRPVAKGLVLQQLHYPDEIRAFDEVPLGDTEVKDAELGLARQLIEQIATETFDPKQYEDEVRKRMLEAIQRKVDGQEITAAPEQPRAQIIDLMEALKASLAKKTATTAAAPAEEKAEKPARRAHGKVRKRA